jgi:Calcineurin-like phosphoesterase
VPDFLIVSDIHACEVDPSSAKAPSYVSTHNAGASGRADPMLDLERLIKDENLKPNYLLCPGDVTDRSSPTAFTYAWSKLDKLSRELSIQLIGTVGNHDLDSRFASNRFDPRGYAMTLTPSIPANDRMAYLEFWAENFTIITSAQTNILVLNTAAYHGFGKESDVEIEHGRISDVTIDLMRASINKLELGKTNIVLCHHQPIKADVGDTNLVGQTRGGDKLVELLNEAESSWIIIHGHKHTPELFYGHGGGASAPVILSCASFSAQINADAQNKNPNQVHFLSIDPTGVNSKGLEFAGRVKSWTWQVGVGWRRSQGAFGLPHLTGFGFKGSVSDLAVRIDTYLTNSKASFKHWDAICNDFPEVQHLVPSDFRAFNRALGRRGLTILSDENGALAQVGRSQ